MPITNNVYNVTINGRELTIRTIKRAKLGNARIFGAIDTFATQDDPTIGMLLYDEKTQPDMWEKLSENEKHEMEQNLQKYRSYKRKALKEAREGLTAIAEEPEVANLFNGINKFTFSQTAGCSCPCSPGLITNKTIFNGSHTGVDLFIETNVN